MMSRPHLGPQKAGRCSSAPRLRCSLPVLQHAAVVSTTGLQPRQTSKLSSGCVRSGRRQQRFALAANAGTADGFVQGAPAPGAGPTNGAHSDSDVVYVGDIGGTNARLAAWQLFQDPTNKPVQLYTKTYRTADYPTFDAALEMFMQEPELGGARAGAACFAVAGAVEDNRCAMTNLDWVLDGEALAQRYGFRVQLLNDFEAVGHGIPALEMEDLVTINNVRVKPKAPKVVMGPGTGLGAATLMWDNATNSYGVWPGEGAHAWFAPRGWKQQALASYVTAKSGYCEIEQVACGSGIQVIYDFLKCDLQANRPNIIRHSRALQSPAEITMAALGGSDPLAEEAIDMFLAIVGAEAGAMALRTLAKGGVYIAGGITPKLMKRVLMGGMLDAFVDISGRPRFHQLLQSIPLFVIVNDQVGQIGAREVAASLLARPAPKCPAIQHGEVDKASDKPSKGIDATGQTPRHSRAARPAKVKA